MTRLFLDANVLFTAAHNPDGKAALVIELGVGGRWEIVTSILAVEETRRNLTRKYPECVARLHALLQAVRVCPPGRPSECPVPLAEKDRPILAGAIEAGATHLLTGDRKHFGEYMNAPGRTGGVRITTTADFLANL